jgi:hypothetical protein
MPRESIPKMEQGGVGMISSNTPSNSPAIHSIIESDQLLKCVAMRQRR